MSHPGGYQPGYPSSLASPAHKLLSCSTQGIDASKRDYGEFKGQTLISTVPVSIHQEIIRLSILINLDKTP